jgi:hypothetical protein
MTAARRMVTAIFVRASLMRHIINERAQHPEICSEIPDNEKGKMKKNGDKS